MPTSRLRTVPSESDRRLLTRWLVIPDASMIMICRSSTVMISPRSGTGSATVISRSRSTRRSSRWDDM